MPYTSGKIPFTTFRGHLKFHRPETLNPVGAATIQFAFPGFVALDAPTEQMRQDMETRRAAGADTVYWRPNPHRRYAGDDTLPRGCYHSICLDEEGDDAGLVSMEMNAYRDPQRSGPATAFDLMVPSHREALGIEHPRRALAVFVRDGARLAEAISHVAPDAEFRQLRQGGAAMVDVPYQVEYREIPRTVDLRVPEVQDWFFRMFRTGDGEVLDKKHGTNITDFLGMLPTLLTLDRGGNDVTHAIGVWLRLHSVRAFIFPSARANAAVTIRGGALRSSSDAYGWNLVDYTTAAEDPVFTGWVDFSPWEQHVPSGVSIRRAPPGSPFYGSWQWMGTEEYQDQVYGRLAGLIP